MFNLQGSEIIIILLLALVVLGPEKLPDAMRRAGKLYADLRKMSTGFQEEFRAAVDEPMREIRDTANVLRDSADFTKLQTGEREEKPTSGRMAPVDPDLVPTDDTPTFDTSGPVATADSKPAPFSNESSAAPRTAPDDVTSTPDDPERPQPFGGQSSAAPRRQIPASQPIVVSAPFASVSATDDADVEGAEPEPTGDEGAGADDPTAGPAAEAGSGVEAVSGAGNDGAQPDPTPQNEQAEPNG